MPKSDVVIVGGGLAGICCALRLEEKGVGCSVLEATDQPGGRIRTDVLDGFLLDRGFQVLLTAYPEARQRLDYAALQLGSFHSGAIVRAGGAFHKFGDPLRHWADAVPTLLAPVGSFSDKLKVNSLRGRVSAGSLEDLYRRPETTTMERLLGDHGFSESMVERFFRPFLGGIFLESNLETSSRKFEFVFRMFCQGEAALPARGMQGIPDQLSDRLKPGTLRTNARVAALSSGGLTLSDGEQIDAKQIVLATEEPQATALLGLPGPEQYCSVACLYYAAEESPVAGPWLVLNGEGKGPINNLCVPSQVRPEYSATGQSLISVTVVDNEAASGPELEKQVRGQLKSWYGDSVSQWRHLRTYHIAYALPFQPPPALSPVEKPARYNGRIFVCGDHADTASIQGAMVSGRRAAEAVIASA